MNTKRVYFGMIGLVVLTIIFGLASLVIGSKLLSKKAHELENLKLDNAVLDAQQEALAKANKDIQKYADLENIAKAVVPKDKDQARAIREIVQIADQSGISIRSITFPASNLGAPSAASPSAASSKSALSQAKPVQGISGVYSLEMTIVPETINRKITYTQFLDFLSRLENNRRTAQVTSIKIDPVTTDQKSQQVTFSLVINIFIRPKQ